MGLFGKKLGKFFSDDEERKKKVRSSTGQSEPVTRDYSTMSESDRRKAEAIDAANIKKKAEEEEYNKSIRGMADGGVKSAKKMALMALKKKFKK